MEPAILFRPLGGLNDIFCGLWACAQYARRHRRKLLIDTYFSGLMADFSDFFQLELGNVTVDLAPTEESLLSYLDGGSVSWPADHNLTARQFLDRRSYSTLISQGHELHRRVDFSKGYRESLLIHHTRGGGNDSLRILPHLRLNDAARAEIQALGGSLPAVYIGVHVRHSDYKTEYAHFLERLHRNAQSAEIYLASDNSDVRAFAEKLFSGRRLLATPPRRPVTPGTPLHARGAYSSDEQRGDATIAMLFDLFALAGASSLVFPPVYKNKRMSNMKFSGFSTLAYHLHRNDEVFLRFFGLRRPTQRNIGWMHAFPVISTFVKMSSRVLCSRTEAKLSDLSGLLRQVTHGSRDRPTR